MADLALLEDVVGAAGSIRRRSVISDNAPTHWWCPSPLQPQVFGYWHVSVSLGIPILPCVLEISICQTVWWLWPVSLARICENVISNHRTRRDGKTMTRTMRQT